VRKVVEALAGKGVVVQVNTEENPALAGRFAVRGIPALFLLKKGHIIDQKAGAHTADAVISWFRNHS
jgi:thioredoxin-like negative regulator of GroEL